MTEQEKRLGLELEPLISAHVRPAVRLLRPDFAPETTEPAAFTITIQPYTIFIDIIIEIYNIYVFSSN